ncbi:cysteine-rich small domain-containing protein [Tepidibacter thalassicus]|uniref:Cysteine-rich small domain-containing protein n=1 Tax=Tepidibacter thalassicus DSM 15285 TaxID=1123350 RepID=A0A1M5QM41_9FIRM|nr:cysteine-rich small domain-containing protein [Tepidibacter thalassicus]SHH14881.1 Cysteine-rich small domain-containing protein [Tepidibacter thalassicus DSM 15285]
MSENYKFVQNTKCEYFPCHKTNDKENFNCLFCFCPLYALKDKCGGNFTYNNDIKDCSNCTIPHSKNGYEHIMSKIEEIIRIGSRKTQ